MTGRNLVADLIVPAVTYTEDADIEFHCKPFSKEGNDTRVNSQFKGICLIVGANDMFSSRIEGLSLLQRASQKEVGEHRYTL